MAATVTKKQPFSFVAFPDFVATWPLIAVGLILCFLHWLAPANVTERVMGTTWLGFLIFTLLALGLDFDVRRGFILFFIGAIIVLILALVGQMKQIPIFSSILKFLKLHSFGMDLDAMLGVNIALLFAWSVVVGFCWLNHRWVVSQGRMERRVFGYKAEEQVITPPYAITYKIPDLMDSLLTFGGGFLVIRKDGKTKRRIGIVFGVRELSKRVNRYQAMPTEEQPEPDDSPDDE